ncbi:M20 peptidase aminoacylase family protein [Brevibacillus choshinensis]|uniref:M20 peptidase aminoacylase family protein n=1 Tax=Brevibacillus choshinensis TaxID=54911 RepID=UPI002E1A53D4|nr:M20 peptidase aminoacylase family protein [Brevibacillus choshinensis]MED4755298.1 M20 peptidase aminoacylase family protein [Brevibacillus choshinensis]MED4784035.1 M20 peptidase aminoacylase family protein [Brevibacillus choshinensis]
MSTTFSLKQTVTARESSIAATFGHLHANPEISWKEVQTTRYLVERMRALGLRVTTFEDCTGLVAEWGEGKPVVGLRTDIDALWQEVDGEWRPNHSCGHDAHMTLIVEAVESLIASGYQPPGTVKILFQPAEEKGTGALKLVEKGVVDDIDYLYGVHLRPIQEMKGGLAGPAIYNGAAMFLYGEITGVSAHGARPHLGINAIEAASAIITGIGQVHTDPTVPATVKMTMLQAGGESYNIIPDKARFALDLRAQTNQAMDDLIARVRQVIDGVAVTFQATIDVQAGSRMVAAEVSDEAKLLMEQAIIDVLGEENLRAAPVSPGAEDFHYYTVERPQIKATMLALGCDLTPGLHHPHMQFDQKALVKGVEILANVVVRTFEQLA